MLRLFLAALPTFSPDADLFRAWAEILARDGPGKFYDSTLFHAYAPGYMYFLWLLGGLNNVFGFSTAEWNYALKLPSIAADLGSAYLLYRFLSERAPDWRSKAPALYLLFPATLMIGPVWGQNDSVLAFFLFLAVYYIAEDRLVAASLAFTAGFIVKPQAIAALPFFLFWVLRDHRPKWREVQGLPLPVPPKVLVRMAGSSLLATLVVIFPFFPSLLLWRPFVDLGNQVSTATSQFPMNSFFAFNFWYVFGKNTADNCDSATCVYATTSNITLVTHGVEFLGISTRVWGLVLFALAIGAVLFVLRKAPRPGVPRPRHVALDPLVLPLRDAHARAVSLHVLPSLPRGLRTFQVPDALGRLRGPWRGALPEPLPRLRPLREQRAALPGALQLASQRRSMGDGTRNRAGAVGDLGCRAARPHPDRAPSCTSQRERIATIVLHGRERLASRAPGADRGPARLGP